MNALIITTCVIVLILAVAHALALTTGVLRGPRGLEGMAGERGAAGPMGMPGTRAQDAIHSFSLQPTSATVLLLSGGRFDGYPFPSTASFTPPHIRIEDELYDRVDNPMTGQAALYVYKGGFDLERLRHQ